MQGVGREGGQAARHEVTPTHLSTAWQTAPAARMAASNEYLDTAVSPSKCRSSLGLSGMLEHSRSSGGEDGEGGRGGDGEMGWVGKAGEETRGSS